MTEKLDCVLPIFQLGLKKEPILLGSGVFILIATEYLIVTASHVIEGKGTDNPIYVPVEGDFYPILGTAVSVDYTNNNIDIAIFKPDSDSINKLLNSGYEPLKYYAKPNNLLKGESIRSIEIISSGYPGSKSKTWVGGRNVKFRRLDLFTSLIQNIGIYNLLGFNARHFYLFEYPLKIKKGEESPDPHGMSGGGLFEKLSLNSEKSCYILRGINIEHLKISNSDKAINVAVYIQFALVLIRREFPSINIENYGSFQIIK